MRRDDIIAKTLAAMRRRDHAAEAIGCHEKPYDEIVVSELQQRFLADDLKTCEDFVHLNVSCCETCHAHYPHYDMYVQAMPDGGYAWICCRTRSAVLGIGRLPHSDDELVDINEVLRALGEEM